jgi:hypothetical protein
MRLHGAISQKAIILLFRNAPSPGSHLRFSFDEALTFSTSNAPENVTYKEIRSTGM